MIYDDYYMDPEEYLRLSQHKYLFRNQITDPDEATKIAWALEDNRDKIMYEHFKRTKAYREKKAIESYDASEEPFEVKITSSIKVK